MANPTVVATWGGLGSNAYCNHTFANSFMDTKVSKTSWTEATTAIRMSALIEASRVIDSRNWKGSKYYWNQRLEFPRTSYQTEADYSTGGYVSPIGTPTNPEWLWMQEKVMQACSEQALYLLEQAGDDTHVSNIRKGIRSYSESVGKISESYSYGGSARSLCNEATRLLSQWFDSPRLVRG